MAKSSRKSSSAAGVGRSIPSAKDVRRRKIGYVCGAEEIPGHHAGYSFPAGPIRAVSTLHSLLLHFLKVIIATVIACPAPAVGF
jgi:hypothetical protein